MDPEHREFIVFRRKGRRFIEERLSRGRFDSTMLGGLWIEVEWLWRKSPPSLHTVLRAWGA